MFPKEHLGFDIRTLSLLIKRFIDDNGNKQYVDNLTGMHGWVIGYLYENRDRDIYQRDLESQFSIRRSPATGILQLMEKNGLILRESVASDARLKSLIPTQRAVHLDKQIGEYLQRTEQRLTQGLTDEQIALFLNIAAHMSLNLDK